MDSPEWICIESRPGTPPEVEEDPDGTYTLHWPHIDVMLSRDELAETRRRITRALQASTAENGPTITSIVGRLARPALALISALAIAAGLLDSPVDLG